MSELTWKPFKRQSDFLSLPDTIKEAMYGGAAGGGKDIQLETLIPTPNGMRLFTDIHVGDEVFSELGLPIKVLAESEIFTDHLCYKLTFDDDSEVVCGEGHLWLTYTAKDREKLLRRSDEYREKRRLNRASRAVTDYNRQGKPNRPDLAIANSERSYDYKSLPQGTVKTTQEIYDTLKVRNGSRINHSVILGESWKLSEKTLLLDPYVLGVWLGDGSSAGGTIAGLDSQILDEVNSRGFRYGKTMTLSTTSYLGLYPKLRVLGVLNNKHIPKDYLFASHNQRLELLQGLMDTDGSCLEDGQCEFSNLNEDLAKGVYHLAASLGIKPFWGVKTSASGNLQKVVKWTSTIDVFKLDRKSARLPKEIRSTQNQRYIVNCEPVETVPTKCIQVDNPTGLFLIGTNAIVTHNSEALLNLPLVREFTSHPRFKGIIFRRTYPELEAELIVRSESQGLYSACGARYNKEKRRWVFPSGAIIQFGHLEYDSDVRKYDSAEYNYIAFDELTSFTEYMYLYMFSRNRSSSPKLPAIIRSGTNPGNIGHGWVRARFVEPAPYGTLMIDNRTGLKRIFIQSKVQDNPHIMQNDPQYVQTLQGMAEKDRRAKLDGDWWTFSGQVFDDYREELFPGEPLNACHVIDPFQVPHWWPKFLAIDWGFSAMTYGLWSALSPECRVYFYREYAIKQAKISQWATDIGRLANDENLTDIVMCQSAWQQRGDDLNIVEQFTKHSGLRPRLADNARVSGKLLLQEYFRWREKPTRKVLGDEKYDNERAAFILRTKGMEAYKSYVISFEPEEPETNLPKIQIFRELKTLRKMIPLCIYDEKSKEDVAEFDGDDPYDTLRYNIKAIDHYNFGRLVGQRDHLVRLGSVISEFEKSGDYTSFHRKLEVLERKAIKPVRAIRRMRHASLSGR